MAVRVESRPQVISAFMGLLALAVVLGAVEAVVVAA
jgi:hypothetical protein